MTTSSSDNLKLRHGSISTAPSSDVQHRHQRQRHVRSRLTIVPLPSNKPAQQQQVSKVPRTSFSASSFSRRAPPADLRTYSRPLNPHEIYDLAITSLESPRSQSRDVTPPDDNVASEGTVVPRTNFIPFSNDLHLPFVDRQSEVTRLLKHSANVSTMTLIELVFFDQRQLSDFRHLIFDVSRTEVDDLQWISTIRAILKPRSEMLWTRLKTILGVPPDVDDDDHMSKAIFGGGDSTDIAASVAMQLISPDQSTLARGLPAPPNKRGPRSPSNTSPIIEEVESTDSNISEKDQKHDRHNDVFEALCFQTAPVFIPDSNPPTSESAPKSDMRAIEGQSLKPHRKSKNQGRDVEPSQIPDISSPSSGSTGSNTALSRRIRFASLRRPSARGDTLYPTVNEFPERDRSPLSMSSPRKAEVGEREEKLEREGHESDVSNDSNTSREQENKESGSRIMTGTGDNTKPRRPSLQYDGTSKDVPSRDLPPINVQSAAADDDMRRIDEGKRNAMERPDKYVKAAPSASQVTSPKTRHPSISSKVQSPSVSTISLSEDAFADRPTTSSPVSKGGRPRFPASFSKSPISRKPRAVTSSHVARQPSVARPDDVDATKQRSTRSHTVSSVAEHPQLTHVRASPPPPPPTAATSRASSLGAAGEGTRPRRAMSLVQRRSHSPHQSRRFSHRASKEKEEEEDGSKSRSSVEVEGLKDGVRGTANPLFGP